MTDKPMKTRRKYVDSGFVHDMMDKSTTSHVAVDANGASAKWNISFPVCMLAIM